MADELTENTIQAPEIVKKSLEPASRGIPSKESLWFHYNKLPMSLQGRWETDDILKLVFPPQFKKAQFHIAGKLLTYLSLEEEATGDQVSQWATKNQIPLSTLRNLVVPRMIATGFLSRERKNPTGQTDKDKRHEMVLKISSKFGEALKHIGGEWSSIVETWKVKRKQNEPKE
ncbi:MAG: hypothetical protein AABY04_01000 [Candidatus Micrarchaeota archaeon]